MQSARRRDVVRQQPAAQLRAAAHLQAGQPCRPGSAGAARTAPSHRPGTRAPARPTRRCWASERVPTAVARRRAARAAGRATPRSPPHRPPRGARRRGVPARRRRPGRRRPAGAQERAQVHQAARRPGAPRRTSPARRSRRLPGAGRCGRAEMSGPGVGRPLPVARHVEQDTVRRPSPPSTCSVLVQQTGQVGARTQGSRRSGSARRRGGRAPPTTRPARRSPPAGLALHRVAATALASRHSVWFGEPDDAVDDDLLRAQAAAQPVLVVSRTCGVRSRREAGSERLGDRVTDEQHRRARCAAAAATRSRSGLRRRQPGDRPGVRCRRPERRRRPARRGRTTWWPAPARSADRSRRSAPRRIGRSTSQYEAVASASASPSRTASSQLAGQHGRSGR